MQWLESPVWEQGAALCTTGVHRDISSREIFVMGEVWARILLPPSLEVPTKREQPLIY